MLLTQLRNVAKFQKSHDVVTFQSTNIPGAMKFCCTKL